MGGIITLSFFVAGIVAVRNRWLGLLTGCAFAFGLSVIFLGLQTPELIAVMIFSVFFNLIAVVIVPWFCSGFKGGSHNSGPSFMGGGAGRGMGGPGGGIVKTDEERKNGIRHLGE